MTVHICSEQYRVLSERPDGEVRWCFYCRKRLAFVRTISAPVDIYSYYGPHATIKCERGHTDGDLFPGRFRELY